MSKVWVTHKDGTREHLRDVDLNDHLYDIDSNDPYEFVFGPQHMHLYPDLTHGERLAVCDPSFTLLGYAVQHEGRWYVTFREDLKPAPTRMDLLLEEDA